MDYILLIALKQERLHFPTLLIALKQERFHFPTPSYNIPKGSGYSYVRRTAET